MRYPEGGNIIMPLLYYIQDGGDGHYCCLDSYEVNMASKTWGMGLESWHTALWKISRREHVYICRDGLECTSRS